MTYMSYCRWQNTLIDLRDCYQSMDPDEQSKLSEDERHARRSMFCMMADMLEHIGVEVDSHELTKRIAEYEKQEQQNHDDSPEC